MKRTIAIIVAMLLISSLLSSCNGCGKNEGPVTTQPAADIKKNTQTIVPFVKSSNPSSGMKSVAVNEPITITFGINMDPSSITEKTVFLKTKTSPVEGEVTYRDRVVVFKPKDNLSYGGKYFLTVKKTVKSMDGIALPKDYVLNFETDVSFAPVMKVYRGTGPIYSDITGYDYNEQDVNTLSDPVSFSVKNEGTVDLSIRSITLVSGDTDQFIIITPPMPSKVAPRQEMTFLAKFKPLSGGTKSALVRIVSNDENIGFFSFMITGKGN
jgi:hypothetical protein